MVTVANCSGLIEAQQMRGRHEAAPDRRVLGLNRRKAPAQLRAFVPVWRMSGAVSVGQMSSRGSRFGAAFGHLTGMRVWLKARRSSS
jgi:hypothetical protein